MYLFDRWIPCTSGHEERSMPSSGTAHSGKVGSVVQSLSAWGFVDASSRLSALRGKVLSVAEAVSAARHNFFFCYQAWCQLHPTSMPVTCTWPGLIWPERAEVAKQL